MAIYKLEFNNKGFTNSAGVKFCTDHRNDNYSELADFLVLVNICHVYES